MHTLLRRTSLLAVLVALTLSACAVRKTTMSSFSNTGYCPTDLLAAAFVARNQSTLAIIQAVAPNVPVTWELTIPSSCSGNFTIQRVDAHGLPLAGSSPFQASGLASFSQTYTVEGTVTERVKVTPVDQSFAGVTVVGSLTVSNSGGNGLVCSVIANPASIDVPMGVGSNGIPYPTMSFLVSSSPAAHVVSAVLVEDSTKLAMNSFPGADATSTLISGVLSRTGSSKVRVTVASGSNQVVCPDVNVAVNPVSYVNPTITLTANGQSGSPHFSDGTSVTIAWKAQYAQSCSASPAYIFPSNPGLSGSISLTLTSTLALSMTCLGTPVNGSTPSSTVNLTVHDDSPSGNGFMCNAVAVPSSLYLASAPPTPFPALPVKFIITTSQPTVVIGAQSIVAAQGLPPFTFATSFPAFPGYGDSTSIQVNALANAPYRTVARFYVQGPNSSVVTCNDAVWDASAQVPTSTVAPNVIMTVNGVAGTIPRPVSGNVDFVWNSNAVSCQLAFPAPQDAQPYPPNGLIPSYGKITLRADQIHGDGAYSVTCMASGGATSTATVNIDTSGFAMPACTLTPSPSATISSQDSLQFQLNVTGPFDYAMFESTKVTATPFVKVIGAKDAGSYTYKATVYGPRGSATCEKAITVTGQKTCDLKMVRDGSNYDHVDFLVFQNPQQPVLTYRDNYGGAAFNLPADATSIQTRLVWMYVDDNLPRLKLTNVAGSATLVSSQGKLDSSNYPITTAFPTYLRTYEQENTGLDAHSFDMDLNISSRMRAGLNTFYGTIFNKDANAIMWIRLVGTYKTMGSCKVWDGDKNGRAWK